MEKGFEFGKRTMLRTPAVRIQPSQLLFPQTFISTTSSYTFSIYNDSDKSISFVFRKFKSELEERQALGTSDPLSSRLRSTRDPLLDFESSIFRFEPSFGEIWPHSQIQIVAKFMPTEVGQVMSTSTVFIKDTMERMTITLRGIGIPPQAEFSVGSINIGHIQLDSEQVFKVDLINHGGVEASFALINKQTKGNDYVFEPSSGRIPKHNSVPIFIHFKATRVIQFNETFEFSISSSKETLKLNLFGRVLGPAFDVTPRILDFGVVGVNSIYRSTFTVENKSDHPFEFRFHVQNDGNYGGREYAIVPEHGSVNARSKKIVEVEFIPNSPRKLLDDIMFDIVRYGNNLARIKVTGEVMAPKIIIRDDQIHLEKVYIGGKYEANIEIANESNVEASIICIGLSESDKRLLSLTPSVTHMTIPPNTVFPLSLALEPIELGQFDVNCDFHVIGTEIIKPLRIYGVCSGPDLSFSSKSISFGKAEVLQRHQQTFNVVNNSTIDAVYRIDINDDSHVFSTDNQNGVIPAGESSDIVFIAFPNDMRAFQGKAILHFENLTPVIIKMSVTGSGAPIEISRPVDEIDAGHVLTQQIHSERFTLTNRGIRYTAILMTIDKVQISRGKEDDISVEIIPQQADIEPGETIEFEICYSCKTPSELSAMIRCSATIGNSRFTLFNSKFRAQFTNPDIDFSIPEVSFVHIHDAEKEELKEHIDGRPSPELLPVQSHVFSILNRAPMTCSFQASVPKPFSLSRNIFSIPSACTQFVEVFADPSFKTDFYTETVQKKIVFKFDSHKKTFNLPVSLKMVFPNISFKNGYSIDFGILLKNTELTKDIPMRNEGPLPVDFRWEMIKDDTDTEAPQLFEIFPINGTIQSEASYQSHVNFYAKENESNSLRKCKAICHVSGGPSYIFSLSGGSADIDFRMDPSHFDFGVIHFRSRLEHTATLVNLSDVPINYKLLVPKTCRFSSVWVYPQEATIPANTSAQIVFKFDMKRPGLYKEKLILQVSLVKDIEIDISADSRPFLMQTSDSYDSTGFLEYLNEVYSDSLPFQNTLQKKMPYIHYTYTVDFGTVVFGEDVERELQLVSTSPFPLLGKLDNRSLKGTGFQIPNERIEMKKANDTVSILVGFKSNLREDFEVGHITYEIPIVFSNEECYFLKIVMDLVPPEININTESIQFEEVIVGRFMTQTFQLQNLGKTPVECSVLLPSKVFSLSVTSCIMPPSSFQNVDVTFIPQKTIKYSSEISVTVKYNTKKYSIPVQGSGNRLKLLFDPAEAVLPPIRPFSEPSVTDVKIVNPNKIPITVFSTQFDFQNFLDTRGGIPISNMTSFVENEEDPPVKIKVCIVVHGARLSGRTFASKLASEHFGGLPIVNLKDIWHSCEPTEYAEKLREVILQYDEGFVVDGLDGIPEPPETETFILHCIRNKSAIEECKANPTNVYAHNKLTAQEEALEYILSCLDDHQTYFIALNSNEDIVRKRIEEKETAERRKKRSQIHADRKALADMNEEEYLLLDEETRAEIDSKRQSVREKVIKPLLQQEVKVHQTKHRSSKSRSSKHNSPKASKPEAPPVRKNKQIVSDPVSFEVLVFQFTLGSILQRIANHLVISSTEDLERVKQKILEYLPDLSELQKELFKKLSHMPKSGILPDNIKKNDPPNNFSIVSTDLLSKIYPSPTKGQKSSRNTRKSKQRPDQMTIASIPEDVNLSNFTPRWNIEPDSSKIIQVSFQSTEIGTFSDSLLFAIENSSADTFSLPVRTTCMHPEFDRDINHIFEKVTRRSEGTFNTSTNMFNFGRIIVSKEKHQKNFVSNYKTTLKLIPFSFCTEISATFMNTKVFQVDQQVIQFKSEQPAQLTVSVINTVSGVFNSTLVLLAKDNPEPFFINFTVDISEPMLDLSQTTVDFGRFHVGTRRTVSIDFHNIGKLPLIWMIKNTTSHVTFSEESGTLKKGEAKTITIAFSSSKPVTLKKPFLIEMTDHTKTVSFGTFTVPLIGETFEGVLDVAYPKGMTSLDFGQVLIGQTKTLTFSLKNKGKYQVSFTIATAGKLAHKALLVSPMNGVVNPGDKLVPISVTYSANLLKTIKDEKMITLHVIDSLSGVSTFSTSLPVTFESYYQSFKVEPQNTLDFGSVFVNTPVTQTFNIFNTGVSPIEYDIVSFGDTIEPESFVDPKKRKATPVKPKAKKNATPSLTLGGFVITPCSGIIPVGGSAPISVTFCSPNPGKFSSGVSIVVPNTSPSSKTPQMKFECYTYLPSIYNEDYEKVFKESHLCLRSDLIRNNVNAFLEDEQTFHFAPTVLTKQNQAKVYIINPLPVACQVDITLKPRTKASNFPFEVSEKSFTLPPNGEKSISITFCPLTSDIFIGLFECTVKGGKNSLKFMVEGTGTLPSITCMGGNLSKGSMSIYMGRVLLNATREKVVTVKNDGLIPCTISLKNTQNSEFIISPMFSGDSLTIQPNSMANIKILFNPKRASKVSSDFLIHVNENTKADISVALTGEGFIDDVIIEGSGEEDNDLSFKDSIVGKQQTSTFYLKNVSGDDIRFTWPSQGDFTFTPRQGIIRSGLQKTISVTFTPEKPTKNSGIKVPCQLSRIELEQKTDWDDTSRNPEPIYKVVPPKMKDLVIRISVIADTIRYAIETTEINFAPTMMYQTRIYPFKITNTCQIRLEYTWSKLDSPFSIQPASGIIEAGQTTVFNALFSPVEVDDFDSVFTCDIPYLHLTSPPQVHMTGISRRPLCHFDVQMSDYLSSGRRHPAYNDPLPEGIKVIEIFSKSVGKKVTKKFDIINPTSKPYEIEWVRKDRESAKTITCISRRAIVSGGKRYSLGFGYNPVSSKTVESQWEFRILEHDVVIHFLVVGKIMP